MNLKKNHFKKGAYKTQEQKNMINNGLKVRKREEISKNQKEMTIKRS